MKNNNATLLIINLILFIVQTNIIYNRLCIRTGLGSAFALLQAISSSYSSYCTSHSKELCIRSREESPKVHKLSQQDQIRKTSSKKPLGLKD